MHTSNALAAFAVNVTAIGLNSLWEDAILVACAVAFVRAFPRANAATRYLIWSVALAASAIVPVATTLPFLSSSPPAAATPAVKASVASVSRAFAASAPPIGAERSERAAAGNRAAARERAANDRANRFVSLPPRMHLAMPVWLGLAAAIAWALVAALGLSQLAIGLFRLERLKRDALPLPVEYRDAMSRWSAALKGHRQVRLCVSDAIDVPVAVGLFDSMILIPRELLQRLSPEEVDQIALHELAHLRRADDWSNGAQRLLLAAFGWNPSVRFAAAQLDLEREVACDDYVLSSSSVVRPYAMCLAKMAESSSWPRRSMAAPGVFATRKHLSLRIERLLFAGRATGTHASIGATALALAGVCAAGVAIAAIAPSVAATQAPSVAVRSVGPARHVAPAVREIVRYVDVPRRVHIVATAPARSPGPALDARSTTIAIASPAARRVVTTPVVATSAPVARADATTKALLRGFTIHVPAIDVRVPTVALDASDGLVEGTSCTGCDRRGADLRGRDLRGVTYTGADFTGADLDGANLSGGRFAGVDFSRARLRGASLRNARLTGCDFTSADLSNADLTGATVSNCTFVRAKLVSALVRSILSTCVGCDFSDSTLGAVDLSNVRAAQIDFSGADLARANLSGSTFTGVSFERARLVGADLDDVTFVDCDLSGTGLRRTALARAKLIDTDYPDDR